MKALSTRLLGAVKWALSALLAVFILLAAFFVFMPFVEPECASLSLWSRLLCYFTGVHAQ